jgi:REP element-mobilizing transposase RayT
MGTTTTGRESVARDEHDRAKRLRAKAALKWPPVNFTGDQALSVAKGFGQAIADAGYSVHACSILPSHVHMVIARYTRDVERIVGHLKSAATRHLDADGLHPFNVPSTGNRRRPSPWAERCWKVFLDSPADIARAIQYVEDNPPKEGKKRQRWSFARAYRG